MSKANLYCVKYNCLIIHLCVNKWLIFNYIVSDKYQYAEPFNFRPSNTEFN